VEGLHIVKLDLLLAVGIERQNSKTFVNQTFINSAFASYSSKDRNEVLARVQGMQKCRHLSLPLRMAIFQSSFVTFIP